MDWRDLTRRQSGVVGRSQLVRSGLSADQVDGLIRRHELIEVHARVYSPRPVPGSWSQRLWAAVLWSGGVISHRSAAPFWGLPTSASPEVHATVPDRRFRKPAQGVRLHRVPLAFDCVEIEELAVTGQTRTVIDLLRTERCSVATTLLDRALQQRWISPLDLRSAYRCEPGRTGNVQLRVLLEGIEPGADAESERRLHAILRGAGLRGWKPQYRIDLPVGPIFADVAFPAQRVVIEVDGRRYHDESSGRFESDRQRQNQLVALGWRVIRVTWRMLRDHPQSVIDQITQLLAA